MSSPSAGTLSKRNLVITHPELCKEWDYAENDKIIPRITPETVTAGFRYKVGWICSTDPKHKWSATIQNRTNKNGTGCRLCYQKRTLTGIIARNGSLAKNYPELCKEWDYAANFPLTPEDVTAGSIKKVGWLCSTDSTHKWDATINNRTRTQNCGCPTCYGRPPLNVGVNDLKTLRPDLATEWDKTKNGELKPEDFTQGSNKKVWWLCSTDSTHKWDATINNRTRGSGCSQCSLAGTSKVEQLFFTVASDFMANTKTLLDARIIQTKGRPLAPDIIGERHGHKVALEYDGYRWHKDNGKGDLRKTRTLLNHGFLVVRIRERHGNNVLDYLTLSDPNLLQLSFEYSLEPEKARETLSKIMEWVDVHKCPPLP